MKRREFLGTAVILGAGAALAACAPKTAAPSEEEGEEVDKATAPMETEETIPLSIATYAGSRVGWQRDMAEEWQEEHPEVELEIIEVDYNEMPKKQLARLATGNLWDVVFNGIKWYSYSVVKGCFAPLDDYVASDDPGRDDFIDTAWDACKWEDQLYGLPYLLHPGNVALIASNLELLGEKGIEPPTDDTTFEEYREIAKKATDLENGIFGTNYLAPNFYDIAPFMSFGSNVISEDGKTVLVGEEEEATAAARWMTELRTEDHIAPLREETSDADQEFQAGLIATRTLGTYYLKALEVVVDGAFEYQLNLHPVGPAGIRGWQPFIEMFSVFSGSEHPDVAYDLVVKETSEQAGIHKLEVSSPSGRKSSWEAATEETPIYARVLEWMNEVPSEFPMPYNIRFSEVQDTWSNNALQVFYGEVPFDEGIEDLRRRVQEIVDLPRPD